ncbi:hypothetical protein TB2_016526 [Malus domestica]
MVTASQLQILQSPITGLISTISTSVNVKLDESNYLNWHFQMQMLLEGHGIMKFVDGSTICPSRYVVCSGVDASNLSTPSENEEYIVWKMHDQALMQLITATLSPVAISCVIGSTNACDLWTRLKEQFSVVSRTSVFQLKSNLQTIKKGTDSVSQYLQRIKEARDYLSAAGLAFADEDIVIFALNGLPPEYNTFRSVIRGRENVISLQEFRVQLLAEKLIVDSTVNSQFLSAMVANTSGPKSHQSVGDHPGFSGPHPGSAGGYRSFHFTKKGKGKTNQGYRYSNPSPRQQFPNRGSPSAPVFSGVLGPSPSQSVGSSFQQVPCQLCNQFGHTAPFCHSKQLERQGCHICGKANHTTWYCFFNDKGPNFGGPHYSPMPPSAYTLSAPTFSPQFNIQALHTVSSQYSSTPTS